MDNFTAVLEKNRDIKIIEISNNIIKLKTQDDLK